MRKNYSTKAFENKYTYSGKDLGANWSPEACVFRVWAPGSDSVYLCLYHTGNASSDDCISQYQMTPSELGTWSYRAYGDLNGIYYTYKVTRDGITFETIDPYAKACGVNGMRGMVLNLRQTDPENWDSDSSLLSDQLLTDISICEISIRDLTSDPSSNIAHKGKFLGLTERGTRSSYNMPTGLDYLLSLGISHVQIMPFFDFGSINEEAVNSDQYNWGYDPVNFNIPEGSYATDPYNGYCRIRELKQMIMALHKAGLRIVMDVVYNHVYHADSFSMNLLVPGYFSRPGLRGKMSNASGCGNDTASERSMVRNYIIDSVNYWADEYHIDGFRFDLAGLLDIETIRQLIYTVRLKHPHVIFYGEGWTMATKTTKADTVLLTQQQAKTIPDFGFFNDGIRDLMRGPVFYPNIPGFAAGSHVNPYRLLDCFSGKTDWTDDPRQLINYISCHDNHTLYDKLSLSMPLADRHEIAARCRLAAAFNILSMGVPFFLAGEETLRSKADQSGHFIDNSYRAPDIINAIHYDAMNDTEAIITLNYYRGLLALRKTFSSFRLSSQRHAVLLPSGCQSVAAFLIRGHNECACVIYNNSSQEQSFLMPGGVWEVHAAENLASPVTIGTAENQFMIAPVSAAVLIQSVFPEK